MKQGQQATNIFLKNRNCHEVFFLRHKGQARQAGEWEEERKNETRPTIKSEGEGEWAEKPKIMRYITFKKGCREFKP